MAVGKVARLQALNCAQSQIVENLCRALAGARWHEGTDQLEQSALTCAIRADNGHYLSFFNREAYVIDSRQTTVTLGYSLNLEDWHGYVFELWRLPTRR